MISILTVLFGPSLPEHEGSILSIPQKYEYLTRDNTHDNIGFARAVNELIEKAQGDPIMLLNPDAFLTEGCLPSLIRDARKWGIAQPRIVNPDGSLQSTGHLWMRNRPGIPYVIERRFEPDHNTLKSASFAAVMIARQVFETIGLLDERFFLYYEDVDFCQRAGNAGWKVRYCPESSVIHKGHQNAPNPFTRPSHLKWLKKWYPEYYVGARILRLGQTLSERKAHSRRRL